LTCLDKYLQANGEKGRERPFSLDKARALLVGYLFHAVDFTFLKARLTDMGVTVDREWRQTLVSDAKVLRTFKFPFYAAVASPAFPDDPVGVLSVARTHGLAEQDEPLLELACTHSSLRRHLSSLSEQYAPLSRERFDAEVERVVRNLAGNTRGFAYVKMRFLQRWGFTLDDCITDCNSRAYEALLFRYPRFDSRGHFVNIFKQAVRHQGLKIVEKYTAQSRSSFHGNGQYRMESLEGYHDSEIEGTTHDLTEGSGIEDDAEVQLHQLLRSGYLNAQDKRAIRLLVGQPDPDFDSWLASQGENWLSLADNLRRLRGLVLRFLDYPESRLDYIRSLLTGEFRVARTLCSSFAALPQVLR
jgi:hypothetical protein